MGSAEGPAGDHRAVVEQAGGAVDAGDLEGFGERKPR
jgi:hypothetical protein